MKIQWVATEIEIDGRGMVPAARVSVGERSDTAIPPEGDSLDCWVGADLLDPPPGVPARDWSRALEHAAREGAAGRGGIEEL